jgi:hypothetical protein
VNVEHRERRRAASDKERRRGIAALALHQGHIGNRVAEKATDGIDGKLIDLGERD